MSCCFRFSPRRAIRKCFTTYIIKLRTNNSLLCEMWVWSVKRNLILASLVAQSSTNVVLKLLLVMVLMGADVVRIVVVRWMRRRCRRRGAPTSWTGALVVAAIIPTQRTLQFVQQPVVELVEAGLWAVLRRWWRHTLARALYKTRLWVAGWSAWILPGHIRRHAAMCRWTDDKISTWWWCR